jgi:hypothetical protein
MLRAHLIEPPPAIAGAREGLECRPELEALVKKALAKDADDRFADAREMLAALDAIPAPAAWLRVAAGQRAPLAGGALPAFSDPGIEIPAAALAPTPAPIHVHALPAPPAVVVAPARRSALPIALLVLLAASCALASAGAVVAMVLLRAG